MSADTADSTPAGRAELPIEPTAGSVKPSSLGHPLGRRSGREPSDAEREADALAVIDRWRASGWR